MRLLSIVGASLIVSACSVGPEISIKEIPASFRSAINADITADNYPAFMAAEGNIYSCRYGIGLVTGEKFSPAKEHIFAAYIKKFRPDINVSQIKLTQVDIYFNQRLQLLDMAGASVIGGAVGAAISNQARSNQTGISDRKLRLYDLVTTDYVVPGENAIGCDGNEEGEYYASRVTGGSSVIVSWFSFEYGGKFHRYRTTYETQTEKPVTTNEDKQQAIQLALESSISSFADQL